MRVCGTPVRARDGADDISIAAGTLHGRTGLRSVAHIFTDDAGDYYELQDDLPRYAGTMP